MKRVYSFAYKQLVENDGDFVGIIAYHLYKRKKIVFIEGFRSQNGKEPDENDIMIGFSSKFDEPYAIKGLRAEASDILSDFAKELLQQELDSLSTEITDSVLSKKRKEVEAIYKDKIMQSKGVWHWKSFLSGTFQSVVGTIVFLMILYIMFIVIKGYKLPSFFPDS